MDDLKILHQDSSVVDKVVASLCDKYGKLGEITVRRGKKNDYLGMTLDSSEDGKYIVGRDECVNEIRKGLPDDMN